MKWVLCVSSTKRKQTKEPYYYVVHSFEIEKIQSRFKKKIQRSIRMTNIKNIWSTEKKWRIYYPGIFMEIVFASLFFFFNNATVDVNNKMSMVFFIKKTLTNEDSKIINRKHPFFPHPLKNPVELAFSDKYLPHHFIKLSVKHLFFCSLFKKQKSKSI